MSNSRGVNGKVVNFLQGAEDFFSKPLVWLACQILFYAIPTLVFLFIVEDRITKLATELFGERLLYPLIHYPFHSFVAAIIVLFFANNLVPKITSKLLAPGSVIDKDEGVALLEAFESIVEQKCNRFSSYAKELLNSEQPADESVIFDQITQPEQQINVALGSLQAYLERNRQDVNVNVRLVRLDEKGNRPVDWFAHAPIKREPRTTIEELAEHGNSTLMQSIKRKGKGFIIIDDVRKESSKRIGNQYVMISDQDEGSIICYPIHYHLLNNTPYVLIVTADKPNFFQPKRKKLYEWILSQFALRIRLEHSLYKIKEASNGKKQ